MMLQRATTATMNIRCNTCRLRSLIRIQQLSRSRKPAFFSTTSVKNLPRGKSRRNATADQPRFRGGGSDSHLSKHDQITILEGLYRAGMMSRHEFRDSIFIQAGLKADAHTPDDASITIEDRMRRLKEWYSSKEVPGVILEEGERVVYERLFGSVGVVEEVRDEFEKMMEDVGGTGVMKEGEGGVLEEVEFEEEGEVGGESLKRGDQMLMGDMRDALEGEEVHAKEEDMDLDDGDEGEDGDVVFQRTHPLTLANRFTTSPSTLPMPKDQLADPINTMLTNISNAHIKDHAQRVFGGPGLPYSTTTSQRSRMMPPKPIALDAYQSHMAEIEADVYMATLIPAVYASVMSVLVETRKRLGTEWAREIVRKAEDGTLRVLDAGGAGAGVLAVRELIRAEWESMHEEETEGNVGMAELDGKAGGESAKPPLGQVTVLTGADTLRKRSSKLLENTTFVPRLPDYVHTEEAKHKGKFDIVIAPHTLWPLKEDYLRKTHVQNLWSLVNAEGGVLMLMEKGVPRGFEMVAGARDLLLETRIAKTDSQYSSSETDIYSPSSSEGEIGGGKEESMIIAPCTNHAGCPMYTQKGHVKGRKDICAFAQRYHRPSFLNRIFGRNSGKNHEDVEFSYLSVMRGRDLRSATTTTHDRADTAIQQGPTATDLAFAGYESHPSATTQINGLTLPRLILPPLKRKGHIILDLCTPSGTLERWTVPRSFSKQAYRDARKASWGDLWAMGAKTRISRKPLYRKPPKTERPSSREDRTKGIDGDWGSDEYGQLMLDGEEAGDMLGGRGVGEGSFRDAEEVGRRRFGRKVGGIREKRDKKGDGRGRRKNQIL